MRDNNEMLYKNLPISCKLKQQNHNRQLLLGDLGNVEYPLLPFSVPGEVVLVKAHVWF